jgi:hypothetical protein
MLTDSPPSKAKLAAFTYSDRIRALTLPPPAEFVTLTQSIEAGMQTGKAQDVRLACEQFLQSLSRFHAVSPCGVRVLASRPLRIREHWSSELFGDYNPSTRAIRVWMRTAVKKDITSFGTFLSTLCHEYCHHLDFEHFKFPDSWHTRGFYERAGALYHYARGTLPNGCIGPRHRVDAGASTGRALIAVSVKIGLLSDGRAKNHSRRYGRVLRFGRTARQS